MVKRKCKHKKTFEFKTSAPGHVPEATAVEAWLSPAGTCPDGKDIRGGVGVLRLFPPSPVSLQASLC